jgi:hypothetical protein
MPNLEGGVNMLNVRLVILLSTFILSGCAMTSEIKNKAAKHLSGECLEVFTSGFEYGYYLSNSLANKMSGALQPKAVFALAKDPDGRYVCASKNNRKGPDAFLTWEDLEKQSIAWCEELRRKFAVKNNCRVFARGLEIVYEDDVANKKVF